MGNLESGDDDSLDLREAVRRTAATRAKRGKLTFEEASEEPLLPDTYYPENLEIGSTIFGKFRVEQRVGIGTTGVVYACSQPASEVLIALKVLSYKASLDRELTQRFRNEIHASYSVHHVNVVRAYEFFRDEERMAYTMEFVDGGSFQDVLNLGVALSFDGIIHVLTQLAEGMKAIHDAGLVHRDIKPANMLMTTDGTVKITDFTTAFDCRADETSNEVGAIGTLEYMSPEVLTTGHADYRSDIYSLGCIAYQAVTSRIPFDAPTDDELVRLKIRRKAPEPIQLLRPDCPPMLAKFIGKALMKEPRKRYQSMRDVLYDLKNMDLSPKSKGGILARLFGL